MVVRLYQLVWCSVVVNFPLLSLILVVLMLLDKPTLIIFPWTIKYHMICPININIPFQNGQIHFGWTISWPLSPPMLLHSWPNYGSFVVDIPTCWFSIAMFVYQRATNRYSQLLQQQPSYISQKNTLRTHDMYTTIPRATPWSDRSSAFLTSEELWWANLNCCWLGRSLQWVCQTC